MSEHPVSDVQRLFDALIELDADARDAYLRAVNPEAALQHAVEALLAAADRARDFLGVLGNGTPRTTIEDVIAGRYRLARLIGAGASSEVYLARDLQLERPVAVKLLRSALKDHAGALTRFGIDARTTAGLEHPHVATVYDFGKADDGRLFIVMAYYAGQTLRDRLTNGPLAVDDAVQVAREIADALAAAHASGIVHRDLKPANVLFDNAGVAKLTDFGIAKLAGTESLLPGVPVGTRAYMSPEQARGDAVDSRSDLWSLGVMLFEMVAGYRPFEAPPSGTVLDAIVSRSPRAFPESAPIAAPLRNLIGSLLEKEPALRPPAATDVARALGELLAPTPPAAAPVASDLPQPLTSFVGRKRELADARRLLGTSRLLTLTGPGGSGKTRLALRLTQLVREEYPDGVWFVPLADIAAPDLVPAMVASALGLRDLGGAPLDERVMATLAPRSALLVLDNFEHVHGAARFVTDLLGACRGLRVLVTSREPLGVQGEQEFDVPPLATTSEDSHGESEAVDLFVQRAQAVRPDFTLRADAQEVVQEICRRLDGLPLALELAAARVKLLSPRAILDRLEHRFELLRADAPDRPARHRTMRQVIDWSYVLLTDAERAVFDRLAVFAGGFSLDAAEALAPEGARRGQGMLDILGSLVNKNLLRPTEQLDSEPRFSMLETVRQFGLERLAATENLATARQAHRRYFIAFAERAARELRGPDQATWFDRLERDNANFRVALDSALADAMGQATEPTTRLDGLTEAARLAVALHRLWFTRGPLLEGERYLRRTIAAVDALGNEAVTSSDLALRARLFSSAASLGTTRSLFPEARDLFTRALSLQRQLNDRPAIATTLNNLAWATWITGDLVSAEAMSREAMAMHRERADMLGVALACNNLGWIALTRCELASAERCFSESLAIQRQRGDKRSIAYSLGWLGLAVALRGDYDRGIAMYDETIDCLRPVADVGFLTTCRIRQASLRHRAGLDPDAAIAVERTFLPIVREQGRLWPLAYVLTELGEMLRNRRDVPGARAMLVEALEVRAQAGCRDGVAESTMLLGTLSHLEGDRTRARELVTTALTEAREYGSMLALIECVDVMVALDAESGWAERATRLLAGVSAERTRRGAPRAPLYTTGCDARRDDLQRALGVARFEACWTAGAASPFGETVRLALQADHERQRA